MSESSAADGPALAADVARESERPLRSVPGAPWLYALLAAAMLLRLAVLVRPLPFIDDATLIDDSYLSLTIARNIARGLGPLSGLAATNGYQPLFVWLMAPVYAWMPRDPVTPIHIALGITVLFDLWGLWLLHRLVKRVSRSPLVPLITVALWAVSPYAIGISLNGLETSIAFCGVLGVLNALAALREDPGRALTPRALAGLGAWLGFAALARVDSLLLWPIALIDVVLIVRRAGLGWRAGLNSALRAGVVGLVVFAPWPVVSWLTTHTWIPVSGHAVRWMELSNVDHQPGWSNFYRPMLQHALSALVRKNAVLLGLIALVLASLPRIAPRVGWPAIRDRVGAHRDAFLFAAVLFVAYTFVIFGHWHFPRYFYPLSVAIALLFAALLDVALQAARGWRARSAIALCALVAGVLGSVAQPAFTRLYAREIAPWGYLQIGQWARDYFPAGAVIGGSQTGALGYVAERLTVVNLDGVVNRACYDAMRNGRASDYVRASDIQWLVWQDDIAFLSRESRRAAPLELSRQGVVPGVRTWGAPWEVYRVNPGPGEGFSGAATEPPPRR